MLLLFKRNDFTTFLTVVIFGFALRLVYFIEVPSIESLGFFYQSSFYNWTWLKDFYTFSPRLYLFFSTVVWILFSVYFKYVVINQRFLARKEFTASMALLLYTAVLPTFVIFSVQGLSAMLLFTAFAQMVRTQYNVKASAHYFLIGLLIGLSSLLYWPSILFIFVALYTLLSFRLFVVREFVAFLLGLIAPIYLFFSFRYLLHGPFEFSKVFAFSLSFPSTLNDQKAIILISIVSIFVLLYGIYLSRSGTTENRLLLLKKWNSVVFFYIISVFIGLIAPSFPSVSWVFSIIPFSIILSSALSNNHKKYNTFTFFLLLTAVLLIQWMIRFL